MLLLLFWVINTYANKYYSYRFCNNESQVKRCDNSFCHIFFVWAVLTHHNKKHPSQAILRAHGHIQMTSATIPFQFDFSGFNYWLLNTPELISLISIKIFFRLILRIKLPICYNEFIEINESLDLLGFYFNPEEIRIL